MKKAIVFISSLFSITCSDVAAQSGFEKTFGGVGYEDGYSVQQTNDGGYVIAGTTESFGAGGYDIYVIRTNGNGDTLWTKTFGGAGEDKGYSVKQTSDGGYIIAGHSASFGAGSYDVYLIKTDGSGDTLWTKTFGGTNGDSGYSVQQTNDGGYIIAGRTAILGAGGWDVYLIKTDNSGETLWTTSYGGTIDEHGQSVQQTNDGGYIITGTTTSFGAGGSDIYLVKTDSSGNMFWTKTFGGGSHEHGHSVQQTTDDGYIVSGITKSFGAGSDDIYLIKTDSSGDTLWTKTFGGTLDDRGYSVQRTSDGGYIIAALTANFGEGSRAVYLIKTDGSGNTIWTKTYGGTHYAFAQSVQQTSDGGYIISGTTSSFGAGGFDAYLIKTDANGDIIAGMDEQTSDDFGVLGYPNPTTNTLNVSTTFQGNEAIHYQIITTLGATAMANKAAAKDFSIDVSPLPAGIYFIRLQSGNAQAVKRFVKE